MTFPVDPAWAVTVGVAGRADVVDVPRCGGGDVSWDECCPEMGVIRGLPVSRMWIASMPIMWAMLRWTCLVWCRLLNDLAPC